MWKLIFLAVLASPLVAQNLTIQDIGKAHDLLGVRVGQTFFCKCPYSRKRIKKCKFTYSSFPRRQKKMEWSHVISPEIFGPSFLAWNKGHENCQRVANFPSRSRMYSMSYSRSYYEKLLEKRPYKGIECVREVNALFRRMEADLYNVISVVGAVNAVKNDQGPGEMHTLVPQFGQCDLKILGKHIEPPNELKGDVARIYFYMENSYPGRVGISAKTKLLLKKWSRLDPVSKEECNRANKILSLQGNINPFVHKKCRN